jgi:hypothetical protein
MSPRLGLFEKKLQTESTSVGQRGGRGELAEPSGDCGS